MSKVNLVWSKNSLDPDYEGTPKHIMHVIKHGDTKFFYLDISRDEAERRFEIEMGARPDFQVMIEPEEAGGFTIDFDDQFVLWENPMNDLQKIADLFLN